MINETLTAASNTAVSKIDKKLLLVNGMIKGLLLSRIN